MALFKITVDTEAKTLEVEENGKVMSDDISYVSVDRYPDYDNPGEKRVSIHISETSKKEDGITKQTTTNAEKAAIQESVSEFLRKSI